MVEIFEEGSRSHIASLEASLARSTFAVGDLKKQMTELRGLSRSFARAMTGAFEDAVFRGEKLDKVFKKLALSLAKIAFRSAMKPIENGIGDVLKTVLTGGGASGGGVRAVPFARGGVLSSPAVFPLGKGVGVAGEAGPEAILPLARGAGGRLGVRASGGAGVIVNFSVNATDVQSFMRSETQIAAMLNRAVTRGNRNL